VRTRQLLSENGPIHLSPKAFDLLALLVQQRPDAIAKGDIHRRLWPETFVSDGSLAVLVAELRGALGDNASNPCSCEHCIDSAMRSWRRTPPRLSVPQRQRSAGWRRTPTVRH
jgi:DNA-binding response OmpR family regulator